RTSRREAAAAVEFAMVLPFIVTAFLGMIEISRALLVKETLSNAAQRGCRTASLPGKANTDITSDVSDVLSQAGISGYTTKVLVNDVETDVKSASRNDMVSVKISVPVSQVFWLTTFFVTSSMVESETVIMLRQG